MNDVTFMERALVLAARGAGWVSPNPLVGAVVVREDKIVGEGWHARYGGDHAEVVALRDAGERAGGATLYVTLEPCNHVGKTPPCTRAIRDAGIARVVYAVDDPNPVAAGGAAWLSDHGIAITRGVGDRAARDRNAPFLFAQRVRTRPFVTLKLAVSLDGALVDATRRRGWLTGQDARRAVHALRATADGIAIGINTALADDPRLTVREVPAPRVAPRRIVFDRHARLPLDSQLVRTVGEAAVIVITDGSNAASERALRDAGVDIVHAATLAVALRQLRESGIHHLMVEGGAGVASALVSEGLVDHLITFQAPVILGAGALSAFAALPAQAVESAPRWRVVARQEFGDDLMTTYAVSGD
jgi:diaminohydroxyphosphoribosylaminopyrimidine deaminase/5-amino-6-(5-phosphoribosylamino)uracil reductase